MYKDELIQIHQLLIYLMRFLLDIGAPKYYFEEYSKLGVSPHHIHRTKAEHKYAMFLLVHSLSRVLAENGFMPKEAPDKMKETITRSREECYRLAVGS
jgi:hypothetical protein